MPTPAWLLMPLAAIWKVAKSPVIWSAIGSVAAVSLAILAYVTFPPIQYIQELETRRVALENNNSRLASDAQRLKMEAERETAKKMEAEQLAEDAVRRREELQAEASQLVKARENLQELSDLQRRERRRLQDEVASLGREIYGSRKDKNRSERDFTRYVIKLIEARFTLSAKGLAEATYWVSSKFKEHPNRNISTGRWPEETWGTQPQPEVNQPMISKGVGWKIVNWGHGYASHYSESFDGTAASLLRSIIRRNEFRHLPKYRRDVLEDHIENFIKQHQAVFEEPLALNINFELASGILQFSIIGKQMKPSDTTGDPNLDDKISAELRRHERAHRELATLMPKLRTVLSLTNDSNRQ